MSSNFTKNIIKLLSGNVLGQIISIIAIPIIARLYSVETYGQFATFLAIIVVLSTISSFGLQLAIVIPKKSSESNLLVQLNFIILTLFCILISCALYVYQLSNDSFLGLTSIGNLIYFIPILVFFQSSYSILSYASVRHKHFGHAGFARVVEGITERGSAIGSGLMGYNTTIFLLIARAISQIISSIYLFYFLPPLINKKLHNKSLSKESYWYLITKYKNYLIYNGPSMLLINSMIQLPTIIFASLYSATTAGLFAISYRIVNIPVSIIGNAVSKVYLQHISSIMNEQKIDKVKIQTIDIFSILFSLLLIPFSLLCMIGEDLFTILLSIEWQEAGAYAQLLSFFAMTTLLAQSFGGLFDILGKQHIRFKFHLINFSVRIGTLLFCINMNFDTITTILCFSIVATIMNLLAIQILFSMINLSSLLYKQIFINLPQVLIFFIVSFYIDKFVTLMFLKLSLVIIVSIIWFAISISREPKIKSWILRKN